MVKEVSEGNWAMRSSAASSATTEYETAGYEVWATDLTFTVGDSLDTSAEHQPTLHHPYPSRTRVAATQATEALCEHETLDCRLWDADRSSRREGLFYTTTEEFHLATSTTLPPPDASHVQHRHLTDTSGCSNNKHGVHPSHVLGRIVGVGIMVVLALFMGLLRRYRKMKRSAGVHMQDFERGVGIQSGAGLTRSTNRRASEALGLDSASMKNGFSWTEVAT